MKSPDLKDHVGRVLDFLQAMLHLLEDSLFGKLDFYIFVEMQVFWYFEKLVDILY